MTLRSKSAYLKYQLGLISISSEHFGFWNRFRPSKWSIFDKNYFPPKLLKSTKTTCSETLKTMFNNYLIKAEFPKELKLGDVTKILKKGDLSRAKNYRIVGVLSSVSKIFERILQRQVSSYADQF